VYNLLVGFTGGVADRSRVGEHTDDAIRAYLAPSGEVDLARLVHLPTLVMPEIGDSTSLQVARVGHIQDLAVFTSKEYRFRFVANPEVPELATNRIQEIADRFQITKWEFSRTHWAVKDVDLYRVLQESVDHWDQSRAPGVPGRVTRWAGDAARSRPGRSRDAPGTSASGRPRRLGRW